MSRIIAAINVAKQRLGLDDDTYRAKLAVITGKSSLRAMTEAERQAVLTVFRGEGFRPSPRTSAANHLTGRYAKKLQALWIAGWNLGLIKDRTDKALLSFVKHQTGLDHTRFLHHADDARAAIEGLKAWLRREAHVSFGNTNGHDWLSKDGAKIAWAQWRILNATACLIDRKGFDQEVRQVMGRGDNFGETLENVTPGEWQTVMNALGKKVRKRHNRVGGRR